MDAAASAVQAAPEITCSNTIITELRARVQQVHRRDRELLLLLDRFVTVLMEPSDEARPRQRTVRSKSQLEIVTEVLRTAAPRQLSVAQIAEISALDERAVRMVLYSNQSRFTANKISPRRITWNLADAVTVRVADPVGELVA